MGHLPAVEDDGETGEAHRRELPRQPLVGEVLPQLALGRSRRRRDARLVGRLPPLEVLQLDDVAVA
ncbi:MAG: hypothetical protein F4229_00695 [Gammaproteobacteria bacterium]|nr:hypothetical protein [Gammaproteobacteria bacterium]